jgi:PAS domain S-box-containing protein
MIAVLLRAAKPKVLAVSALLLVTTVLLDWLAGHNVSLAALYILPVMLAAVVLRLPEIAAAALVCSYLRGQFEAAGSSTENLLRFVFAAIAYYLSGLFVTVLARNHALRRHAEEQLRLLAESSPAAILTTDGRGVVVTGNVAADQLFGIPEGQSLRGRNIGGYLPILQDALRLEVAREGIRTAAKCQGYREDGGIFQAHIWFSSHPSEEGAQLAAIAVDSSEEMRDREQQGLQQLMRGNRIAAAAVAHEVRNFCGAMQLRCDNLRERHGLAEDGDLAGLCSLIGGLESLASLELQSRSREQMQQVQLRTILDDLRILIEAEWQEIGGAVIWTIPESLPAVIAEPHGLLQAFLNVAQNGHRAVSGRERRQLEVRVTDEHQRVRVEFEDTGPGVRDPSHLFQPFQSDAEGAGMGLYVSRVLVRSYGGEMRYEPRPGGSCFTIELEAV